MLTRSRTRAVASARRTIRSICRRLVGDQNARPRLGLVLRRADRRRTGAGRAASQGPLCPARPSASLYVPSGRLSPSLARHQGDSSAAFLTAPTTSKSHAARQQHEREAGLAVEAMRREQGAILGRAGLGPGGEAVLVDEVDRAGFLAPVGDEQGCEIGHRARSRTGQAAGPEARLVIRFPEREFPPSGSRSGAATRRPPPPPRRRRLPSPQSTARLRRSTPAQPTPRRPARCAYRSRG